jgi:ribosomal protein S18 acetylase RimI-like enzyme
MVIRKAVIEDMEQLVSIRLEYLKVDFQISEEQETRIKKELPEYYVRHMGNDFIAYIAQENDEIVASVFLVIIEMPSNQRFITGKIGDVLNVYTKEEYRRKGLAYQLMNIMLEEAKARDLSYLELKATECGYPLYKKLGFTEQNSNHVTPMRLVLG